MRLEGRAAGASRGFDWDLAQTIPRGPQDRLIAVCAETGRWFRRMEAIPTIWRLVAGFVRQKLPRRFNLGLTDIPHTVALPHMM
jgi:hypothetical protein